MKEIKIKIKKILMGKKPIVIMLHSVDYLNDSCTISFNNFTSFIDCFEKEIRNKKIVLTFDDGFESVYTKCFRYLRERNLPFVCFLVVDFIDKPNYLTKHQLHEMLETGLLTIGSHGMTHAILTKIGYSELKNEIVHSREELEKIFNIPVSLFAYSHGAFNKKCVRLVRKAGYRFAYSATSNLSDYVFFGKYRIPRYNLKNKTVNQVINEVGFYEEKSV